MEFPTYEKEKESYIQVENALLEVVSYLVFNPSVAINYLKNNLIQRKTMEKVDDKFIDEVFKDLVPKLKADIEAYPGDTTMAQVIMVYKNDSFEGQPLKEQFEATKALLSLMIETVKKNFLVRKQVKVEASIFTSPGKSGDFEWMITRPEYSDALFIFNDNEHQYLSNSTSRGGGNAAIRPFKAFSVDGVKLPRAWGIPTGVSGGYPELTDKVKLYVDAALSDIFKLTQQYRYDRVIFSGDGNGGLGVGIFAKTMSPKVTEYIVQALYEKFDQPRPSSKV